MIADTLSRAYAPATNIHQTTSARVNAVQNIDLQPEEIHGMQKTTADDKTLQTPLKVVKHGWPEDKCLTYLPVCRLTGPSVMKSLTT